MKLKLKISLMLLVSIALIYTACKKTSSSPAGPTLTSKQVTSEVALNISQSLFGGIGAFDVSSGLSAPSSLAVHTSGKVLNSLTNPDCGLVVDTTMSYSVTEHDTTASISGTIKFTFICTNDVVSGFTTADNLSIGLSTPQLAYTYKVAENLTMLSIDPSNNDSNLSLNGSLNSTQTYTIKTGSKGSGSQTFNYTLTSLVIDPNAGDVVSGKATFTTQGSGPKGIWSYTGTITFLGNQMATVVINGTTYTVNLATGVVS